MKTRWDETGCSVDTWNPFQTWVEPVLLCSVDRAIITTGGELLLSQCEQIVEQLAGVSRCEVVMTEVCVSNH